MTSEDLALVFRAIRIAGMSVTEIEKVISGLVHLVLKLDVENMDLKEKVESLLKDSIGGRDD